MDLFTIVRRISVGPAVHTLGVAHHRTLRRTNPEKTWQRYASCLVLDGGGAYRDWVGRTHEVVPGCLVHHLPERWHDIDRTHGGWQECALSADSATCRRWIDLGIIDEDQPVQPLGDPKQAIEGFLRLRRLLSADQPSSWRQAMIEAEQLLLGCWERDHDLRSHGDGAASLDMAATRLATDHGAMLRLEDAAADSGLGYVMFRRRFRERFGCSPGAWRNRHRLEHAAVVLAHRRVSLADLAAELGYADQFVFSRRFKQHHGCTPSEHRRRHLSE